MPMVMELKDKNVETIFNERDFAYLVEQYMGHEAADYFRSLMEELEHYREEDYDYD